MANGDKPRVGWLHRVGPVVPSDLSRYIGSGEAASYRRLPPPEPQKALSWHVPLPVLMGPLGTASLRGRFLFGDLFGGEVERRTVQDVGLGDFDRREAEDAHRLDQDRGTRDDRGRAVGVETGYLFALVKRQRSQLAEHAVGGLEQQSIAVDLLGVVWVQPLVDRGQRGGGAGDRNARLDRVTDFGRDRVFDDRADCGAQTEEVLVAGRVFLEMAFGLAHRA